MGQCLLIIEASRPHSDTPHSVGLHWTFDQPVAETSTWKHTTFTRYGHPCPGGIEPAFPASERKQNHTLDSAATGIGSICAHTLMTTIVRDTYPHYLGPSVSRLIISGN